MKTVFLLTALSLLGNISMASVQRRPMLWSDDRGFVSSAGCRAGLVEETEFFVTGKSPVSRKLGVLSPTHPNGEAGARSISDYVIHPIGNRDVDAVGFSRTPLTDTYWQAAMSGSRFEVLVCKRRDYLLFDVYRSDHRVPVEKIGVSNEEIGIFSKILISTPDEAEAGLDLQDPGSRPGSAPGHRGGDGRRARGGEEEATEASDASAGENVICLDDGTLKVRDQKLQNVLFEASDLDPVQVQMKKGERKPEMTIDGVNVSFVRVKFPARDEDENTGFVAEKFVTRRSECHAVPLPPPNPGRRQTPAPAPRPPTPLKPAPIAKPAPHVPARQGAFDVLVPNCAEKALLRSAKKSVARHWHNRSAGKGACAKGVRYSLEESGVGDIHGGIGNAVDLVAALKNYGYVNSGIKDVARAPAGAVLIFSGRYTSRYFKNHRIGKPPGNWVGHVTIKGDDGFYYTDARTRDAAVGWIGARNIRHVRNLLAVMVPGEALASEYAGRCAR